jgi:branched-chain amino acid transport system substrate-binding protein
MKSLKPTLTVLAVLIATQAQADIKIGAVLSLTGPAASLGIPARNTIDVLPRTAAGEAIQYIVLDDGGDPAAAVRAARKLVDEEKVDIIIGPSVTPTSLALLEIIGPAKTPMVSLAGSAIIAAPVEGNRQWAFKLAPEEPTMGAYIVRSMVRSSQKSVGFIGFNDAFGDSFIGALKKAATDAGVRITGDERYGRSDTSVTAQALKILSGSPDAVVIGASGTPGVTPVLELKKLGYKGQIYISQAMANPDVLKLGGAALNGVLMPVSPVLVAEQLPQSNPLRAPGIRYTQIYEAKYGAGSRSLFGATVWDAFLILEAALPKARAAAAGNTPEFRTALRDAMQQVTDLAASQGVFNMSASNHNGTDLRAQLLVRIEDGAWKYVPLD